MILSSASLIRQLLVAELIDELRIYLCPEVLGTGPRLLPDGVPRSTWRLDGVTTMGSGAVALEYSRA